MSGTRILTLDQIPDLAAVAAALPDHYPCLLESAATGPQGRYSMLLRRAPEQLCLDSAGQLSGPGGGQHFLDRLQSWYLAERAASPEDACEWPFLGGWFIYLAYETAAEIERGLRLPNANDGLPRALAVRCPGALLVRHGTTPDAVLVAESEELAQRMLAELQSVNLARPAARLPVRAASLAVDQPARFEAGVAQVREYIAAGDVFQVNLSRGWQGHFAEPIDPVQLYRHLRTANPAPFAGMLQWGRLALLSSSPERLVAVAGRKVETRPIAGTHPRGRDPGSDSELSRALLAHPKERAEHIMLIDLERNDLGRVCVPGSVEVDELMTTESYAHVHHIVSNVRGRLRPEVTPIEVIRAVFPGGTITGCPKVRCMEIIAELEGEGRGFYTGSLGYLDRHGRMDMNILIRSMLTDGKTFRFRTGAGIVADSQPQLEVAETVHKARGLLAAMGADPDLPGNPAAAAA